MTNGNETRQDRVSHGQQVDDQELNFYRKNKHCCLSMDVHSSHKTAARSTRRSAPNRHDFISPFFLERLIGDLCYSFNGHSRPRPAATDRPLRPPGARRTHRLWDAGHFLTERSHITNAPPICATALHLQSSAGPHTVAVLHATQCSAGPTRRSLTIATTSCQGLSAAPFGDGVHRTLTVHRDVKPSNILLEQGVERALLTDFGLARAQRRRRPRAHTGYHPGTPQYMSPEQASHPQTEIVNKNVREGPALGFSSGRHARGADLIWHE